MHSPNVGTQPTLNILEVSAGALPRNSVSRSLTQNIINGLETRHGEIALTRRDLSEGLQFVDQDWIVANFTPEEDRTQVHRDTLAESDKLVDELQRADIIVIGAPMYNFGVPAVLKAWVDMIARARLTFRYTENGPEGLLKGKKAYLVVTSGGVAVNSHVDFATPYLRQALRFVGISDVEIVAADQLNEAAEKSIEAARARIADLIHTTQRLHVRAA